MNMLYCYQQYHLFQLKDIDNAINLFNQNDADSVISTTKLDFPNEWILDVTDSNLIQNTKNNISIQNRQNYKYGVIANGGIYVLRHSLVSKGKNLLL